MVFRMPSPPTLLCQRVRDVAYIDVFQSRLQEKELPPRVRRYPGFGAVLHECSPLKYSASVIANCDFNPVWPWPIIHLPSQFQLSKAISLMWSAGRLGSTNSVPSALRRV